MLEVRDLSVSYGRHQALNQVSLTTGTNEIVVILGANGAGKTTLLKAIAGMVPALGQVSVNGQAISGLPSHEIVEAGLALVPEGRGIFGELSVQENLTLGAYARRARTDEAANLNRVFSLFSRLAERRKQAARTMSGGEQQMVAIGRAMMSAPAILMLDEPSLGLSPLLCRDLFKALKVIRDAGVGVLLVEQNARQSLAIADRAYLLENGRIVGEGSASQMASDPAVQKAYLGGAVSSLPPDRSGVSGAAPGRLSEQTKVSDVVAVIREPNTTEQTVASTRSPIDDIVNRALTSLNNDHSSVSRAKTGFNSQSIDALVDRAARMQKNHIDQVREASGRQAGNRGVGAVAPYSGTDVYGPGPSLAKILSDIEAAAIVASSASSVSSADDGVSSSIGPRVHIIGTPGSMRTETQPAPDLSADRDSGAPVGGQAKPAASIQVWRKSSVRVYRRQHPDGPLKRIDNTE